MRFASKGLKDEGCFMNKDSAVTALIQAWPPQPFVEGVDLHCCISLSAVNEPRDESV
jgi:hypothetical protein